MRPHYGMLFVVLLAACSKQEASAPVELAQSAPSAGVAELSKSAADTETSSESETSAALTSKTLSQQVGERRFVITSTLNFRVKHVLQASNALEDLSAKHGGFVVDNQIHAETGRTEQNIRSDGSLLQLTEYTTRGKLIVRIPSANTQAFIRDAAPWVEFLDGRQFSAQDVHLELLTQKLVAARSMDAQGRLNEVAKRTDKDSQSAQAVVIGLDVRADRDQAEINRLLLEDKVGFSTIEFNIYQNPEINRNVVADFDAARRETRPSFLLSAWLAIKSGWFGLLAWLVGLIRVWPVIVIAGAVFVWWRVRKSK